MRTKAIECSGCHQIIGWGTYQMAHQIMAEHVDGGSCPAVSPRSQPESETA